MKFEDDYPLGDGDIVNPQFPQTPVIIQRGTGIAVTANSQGYPSEHNPVIHDENHNSGSNISFPMDTGNNDSHMPVDEPEYPEYEDGNETPIKVDDDINIRISLLNENFIQFMNVKDKNRILYDFTENKDVHLTNFNLQCDNSVVQTDSSLLGLDNDGPERMNQMALFAREPLRNIHSKIMFAFGYMKSFVNDNIDEYWKTHIASSKDIAESTKFLMRYLYQNEAHVLLWNLFFNFQFDVVFYTFNSKEESNKYPDLKDLRTCMCPCSRLQGMRKLEHDLAFLFEENEEIKNPKDFNCPNERMTIDDFINHINVKCNQGYHFHMAIRAYISFIHDYNFDMNAETNCNLNNKPHYHLHVIYLIME